MMSAFSCLHCSAPISELVCEYKASHRSHQLFFRNRQIVRCQGCGLVQIDRVPPDGDLADFYAGAYRNAGFNAEFDAARYPYDSPFLLSRGRAIRQLVEQHLSPKAGLTILEVGSGYGHNLHAFREKYPDCSLIGVEGDPSCAEALGKLSADVVSGFWREAGVQEAVNEKGPIDVLILAHVLEHVTAPTELLASFRPLVRDGLVVIEVPNAAPTVILDPHSPHLTFFGTLSLQAIIESAGGSVQWIGTCGTARHSLNHGSPYAWLKRLIPSRVKQAIKKRLASNEAEKRLTEEEIRNVEAIPISAFAEYGERNRPWLRAVVRFDPHRLSSPDPHRVRTPDI